MSNPVKITTLHVENVKRVKAVHMEPTKNGLTVIGGRNGQGKTSVLDAVAWALGGGKREPSKAKREGSMSNPEISLVLSNGLRVERKGKNGTLSVFDPSGARAGQSLLDAFVSQFALDLPKFLQGNSKAKADTLLQILGIGDKLAALDRDAKALYDQRHAIGVIADSKKKYADELPEHADAPMEPVSVSELIQQQQAILAKNGENARNRNALAALKDKHTAQVEKMEALRSRIDELKIQLNAAEAETIQIAQRIENGEKAVSQLQDESTEALERSLADIESINAAVAANQQKAHAQDEAAEYRGQYDALTEKLDAVRSARMALLDGADLPLPGLTVVDGELLYNGQQWDCMSGSEQLRVAVAIVRRLSPNCGFVLMDKLEQMDLQTMREFGAWLEVEGLQVIATRVSTGDECSIVIEDGLPVGQSYADVTTGVSASDETETETPPTGAAMDWED